MKYSGESRSVEDGTHCHLLYLAPCSLLDGEGRTDEPVASKSFGSPQSKSSTTRKPLASQQDHTSVGLNCGRAHAVQLGALPLPAFQVEVPLQLTAFLGVGPRWNSQPDLFK